MPASCAFFAASYAACCAANGVPLREPRKPRAPADDCAIRFPSRSVIEIIVLLNDAAICTSPLGTFFFSFLRKTFFFPPVLAICYFRLPISDCQFYLPARHQNRQLATGNDLLLPWRLLLRDGCTSRTFARASVCMSSLATHWQRPAMPETTIATDIHQALDVHLNALAKVAFDLSLRFQNGTDAAQLIFTQIAHASVDTDTRFLQHRTRTRAANAVDVSEADLGSFIWR